MGIQLDFAAVKINKAEDVFFPIVLLFKEAFSLEKEMIKEKEKQLMGSMGKDIAARFSCKARNFWLNLAKSFQILDSGSQFAEREPPSFSADSTVLCNLPISMDS